MNSKNVLRLSLILFTSVAPLRAQADGYADNLKVWNRALTSSEGDPPTAPPVSATPTLQLCIQHLTNRSAVLTWGPPQAILQCSAGATGTFTNIPGATTPYQVDTRFAPARLYRACLQVERPTLFMWRDTCRQPGRLVLDWAPRDSRLQETRDYSRWDDIPSVPTNGWYYPATIMEPPPVPGGVQRGIRAYRTAPRALASSAPTSVYSVNILAWAYVAFPVGQTNFFSFPFVQFDRTLNTLLPLPAEAEGTLLWFFDTATQSYGLAKEFQPDLGGWVEPVSLEPAIWPVNQSACVIAARSSQPGATSVTTLLFGEVPQGIFRRTLPPGLSLNGPLVPGRGGITTTHRLFPNDGDEIFLFNPGTRNFDSYEFLAGFGWLPAEPVIGVMDAFFYLNNNGPLVWTASFFSTP